jgi:hypothetical protein
MRIETGTTNERLARSGIIVLAMIVFAAWFAVDGWYRYPRKTMEIFQKDLKLENLPAPNPKLGYPEPIVPRTKYRPGMIKAEVIAELGKPLVIRPAADERNEHWHYVGQFGRLDLEVERDKDDARGKVVAANWEQTPADYRQDSIRQQKFFAGACALLSVVGTVWLIGIWRTRVVVDEAGLAYGRRVIPWEAMTELDSAQYHAKGWLTLLYRAGQSQRKIKLDSFKIDAFDEVIDAICLQKGFINPIPIDEPIEEAPGAGADRRPDDEGPQ